MPTSTPTHSDLISSCSSSSCEEPRAAERRGLPGLPGGPGLGESAELEISDEVLDALLAGASTPQQIAGPDGLLGQLTRRLLNRALEAELTEHLGYEAGEAPPGGAGNARNGKPSKTILTDQGPLQIRAPRDRKGTFEPQIVKKRQTRWVGFDDRVISLYARGLTVREIGGHLAEIYGTEVSPDLISKITDTVLADAKAWQNRPLERVYPIVYLDALIVKIRDGHAVRNQACYGTGHRAECQGRSLLAGAGSLPEARSAGKVPAQHRNDVRRYLRSHLERPGADWPTQRDEARYRRSTERDAFSGHRLAALLVPLFPTGRYKVDPDAVAHDSARSWRYRGKVRSCAPHPGQLARQRSPRGCS